MALNPNNVPLWAPEDAADPKGAMALPLTAYAQEVATMPQADRRILARTAGPVIKYAAYGVISHFLLWLLTPVAEYALAECPENGGKTAGIVTAPYDWLTLVGYLISFAPWHLYCQYQCMKHVIIPQLDMTSWFSLFGVPFYRFKMGYYAWLTLYSAFTLGSTLNTLTNGQILGRTVATYMCGEPYEVIEERWQSIMDKALIHLLPGFHTSSLLRISLCFYALMLATPIFGFIYAWPRSDQRVVYDLGAGQEYRTFYNCTPTDHGAVLMVLSSLARFEAVTFQDVTYATKIMDAPDDGGADSEYRCLSTARAELDRAIARFLIISTLQDALQTSLQTTVVGIDWCIRGSLDFQMFLSVILCFCNTLGDIPDAVDVCKIVRSVHARFSQDQDGRLEPRSRRLLEHGRSKLYRFVFYCFLFVSASCWSFAKLLALFVCDHHIWNFHPGQIFFHLTFEQGCA